MLTSAMADPDLYEAGDLLETGILNYRMSTTTQPLQADDLLVRPEDDEDDSGYLVSTVCIFVSTMALTVISTCTLADHEHYDDHDVQAEY